MLESFLPLAPAHADALTPHTDMENGSFVTDSESDKALMRQTVGEIRKVRTFPTSLKVLRGGGGRGKKKNFLERSQSRTSLDRRRLPPGDFSLSR